MYTHTHTRNNTSRMIHILPSPPIRTDKHQLHHHEFLSAAIWPGTCNKYDFSNSRHTSSKRRSRSVTGFRVGCGCAHARALSVPAATAGAVVTPTCGDGRAGGAASLSSKSSSILWSVASVGMLSDRGVSGSSRAVGVRARAACDSTCGGICCCSPPTRPLLVKLDDSTCQLPNCGATTTRMSTTKQSGARTEVPRLSPAWPKPRAHCWAC